jgi:hypothetical protein
VLSALLTILTGIAAWQTQRGVSREEFQPGMQHFHRPHVT